MSTIKNGKCQLLKMARSLYCHFSKITKETGTSFQYPVLNQKHVRNTCQTAH